MHVLRLILVGALGCLVGCGFHSNDAKPIDAAPDVPPDAPCLLWDALNLSPGVTPCHPPNLSLSAGAYTLNTDTGQISGAMTAQLGALIAQGSGPMLWAVNVGKLSIDSGAMVSITGTHPLVFVVDGDATIAGTIDVSAHSDSITGLSTKGPGGDDAGVCTGGVGADGLVATGTGGGGGAGGGGLGDVGGNGGDGNGTGHGNKGVQGNATGDSTLVPLRGGCAGGHGGGGTLTVTSGPGGRAGNGGGALEVTARGVIDMSGTLKAAGSGGGPPPLNLPLVNGGGGAGGSGGAILLDGDTVHVEASGALCANGGGGGVGVQGGVSGKFGEDGTCSATLAAKGGMGPAGSGNGGDGGRLGMTNGQNGVNAPGSSGGDGGGGGGGGSVGRIRIRQRTTGTPGTIDSANVSPAAVP